MTATPTDGDGTHLGADELAEGIAAALLGLDDGSAPELLAVDVGGGLTLEVLGLRYEPHRHALVLLVRHTTRRARPTPGWLRGDDDVTRVDDARYLPLELCPYRRLRGFPPRHDVTFTFEPGDDALDALRFAYGGPPVRPVAVNDTAPPPTTGTVRNEPPDATSRDRP